MATYTSPPAAWSNRGKVERQRAAASRALAAAQQVVLQKHEAEIKELRERIALLEAQIGTQ